MSYAQTLANALEAEGIPTTRADGTPLSQDDLVKAFIAKHEKKYEWTKQGIMNLFDSLNGIKTYQSLLDEPGCKFWINEVGTIQSVILISLSSNAERVPIFQVLLIVQDRVLV